MDHLAIAAAPLVAAPGQALRRARRLVGEARRARLGQLHIYVYIYIYMYMYVLYIYIYVLCICDTFIIIIITHT